MAELQPPVEPPVNGGGGSGGATVSVPAEPVSGPTKRQRRPSVRLGEIGDQHTYDNYRKPKQHQWKYPSKDPKSSKTRHLINLSSGAGTDFQEIPDAGDDKDAGKKSNHTNTDCVAIGGWKIRDSSKSKRGFSMSTTKRVRSNWVSKLDDGDERFEEDFEFDDDGYREFDSGSQLKEQSLNLSIDNDQGLHYLGGNRSRDGVRVRVSDGIELDGPSDRNGVRVWLNQLGLIRYASVFEVHEVDDEVLPLLTLEDLKDMGINAVGSRRKMFCSIQKLGKGFS